jgi:hypothetical protein
VVLGIKEGVYWWLEPTQRKRFPYLSKMAIDILLIPAMSAEPERLFSGVKLTITDRRNNLGIVIIQALECLKLWMNILELEADKVEDEDEEASAEAQEGGDDEVIIDRDQEKGPGDD